MVDLNGKGVKAGESLPFLLLLQLATIYSQTRNKVHLPCVFLSLTGGEIFTIITFMGVCAVAQNPE
jgi:hypothetical protein